MMGQAQGKPREKTVKSFYSKREITIYVLFYMQAFYCYISGVSLSVFSPQAIFKDPFRGGNNILVLPVATESSPYINTFSLLCHLFVINSNKRARRIAVTN
jgi:hypothetical protein